MPQAPGRLTIENAQLLHGNFKNFSGEERRFNAKGQRNFCVRLDPALAQTLITDGWNVKTLQPREDDEDQEITYYLKVKVNYNSSRPPRIVMMSGPPGPNGIPVSRSEIREDMVDILDGVNMENVDLVINPSTYDPSSVGGTGITAYLKTMFVTIEEDDIERKYSVLPNDAPVHDDMSYPEPD